MSEGVGFFIHLDRKAHFGRSWTPELVSFVRDKVYTNIPINSVFIEVSYNFIDGMLDNHH
jgi:hypothetical protein